MKFDARYLLDGDMVLEVPQYEEGGVDVSSLFLKEQRYKDFLSGRHISDLPREMGALKSVLGFLVGEKVQGGLVFDLMGGFGFSALVLKKYLKPSKMVLNDLDPWCAKVLWHNFGGAPGVSIFNEDARCLDAMRRCSVCFVDFYKHTLRHTEDRFCWLKKIFQLSRWTILTDTACFGLQTKSPHNVKGYGLDLPAESLKDMDYRDIIRKYCEKVKEVYRRRFNVNLEAYVMFNAAALFLFDCLGRDRPSLVELPWTPMPLTKLRDRKQVVY